MKRFTLLRYHSVTENLLVDINRREAALWIRSNSPANLPSEELIRLIALPWRMVILEVSAPGLINNLERYNYAEDHLVRKRGFLQIISGDPNRIQLPNRCLPIYLLNGKDSGTSESFQTRYLRMAMLEELRRSQVRQVLIVSEDQDPTPPELSELWASGLRSHFTFATETGSEDENLEAKLNEMDGLNAAIHLSSSLTHVVSDVLFRFEKTFPEQKIVVRLRDRNGLLAHIDVTELDDPERPLLEHYDIIQERDLPILSPDQLSEEEFVGFFTTPDYSWSPYAAGLPWERDKQTYQKLARLMAKLNAVGPEENCVAYFTAEPGAGGTTLARTLAWTLAEEGYPVLVAKGFPFAPDAVPVANFVNRVRLQRERQDFPPDPAEAPIGDKEEGAPTNRVSARYEVPWLIVFDRIHWEYRETELKRFRNEMAKHGRPVCLLVVAGPVRDIAFFDTSIFHEIAELNHTLSIDEARQLGRHLNQFLRVYGKPRENWQWDNFYEQHTIRHLDGVAAFWVTLSFWIQGQYDLSESIQEWIYRCFRDRVKEPALRLAILEIAALSAERLPMADGLLPFRVNEWPVSHVLEDHRASLGPIGLTRLSADGQKYWALVHDVLGRFLINAVFYDFAMRKDLGFETASDPDHLRFLLLERISGRTEIAEVSFRDIGDDFATTIFKIDPDHGYGTFANIWREVLQALDAMPRPLQDGSRVFRHHAAVTRRRIAKLDQIFYKVGDDDRVELLNRAISDLLYALQAIEYVPGSEPDVNLYNSLAHAYHDLADVHEKLAAEPSIVQELRQQAKSATRQAYENSPSNSFVIETYVRDLLITARSDDRTAVASCVEVMGILYSAISSNEEAYRRAKLGDLADQALSLLFEHAGSLSDIAEPVDAVDVLTKAWVVIAENVDRTSGTALSELPERNRNRAIEVLSNPVGRGNMQVLRLSYDLVSATRPFAYRQQMELVEQLESTDYRLSPQVRLEYAILLYQTNRPSEGDKTFRGLRSLWRETEYFVQVPNRLRWLREEDGSQVRTVHAVVGSDRDLRAMARVSEFKNLLVPFRGEEFGIGDVRPGLRFTCRVSFGHNGPFLRPTTATVA